MKFSEDCNTPFDVGADLDHDSSLAIFKEILPLQDSGDFKNFCVQSGK